MQTFTSSGVWMMLFLVCACSSGSADATKGSELFNQRAEIACRKTVECCPGSESASARYNACIEAEANARRAGETQVEELNGAIARDTASIDETQAGECFKQVAALDCAGWARALTGSPPAACFGIVVGKVAPGAVCEHDYDCESQQCSTATEDNPTRVCLATRRITEGCSGAACDGICAAEPRAPALFGN